MTDEIFRDGKAFITREVIQVGDDFIPVDDIKSYALERDRNTLPSQIKADPAALRITVLVFGFVLSVGISTAAALIKGEVGFDESFVRIVMVLIVAAIGALIFLFGPRKARFCLSVVDREIKICAIKVPTNKMF